MPGQFVMMRPAAVRHELRRPVRTFRASRRWISAFDSGKEETKVWMPAEQWNLRLIRAIKQVLPPGTTMAFNHEGDLVSFR